MITTTEKVWYEFNTQLKLFILKRIPDEQSAEDILQDVFLKIHAHIDTLRSKEKLQGWIYQITRNAIHDYYRSYKATSPLPETLDIAEDLPGDDLVAELAPCIKEMVDNLPNDYREALILTEYQGLTQKELGEKLGISFSGAKSRVQRAREKLKNMRLDGCRCEVERLGSVIDYQAGGGCCWTPSSCAGQ